MINPYGVKYELTECEYDPGGPRNASLGGADSSMDLPRRNVYYSGPVWIVEGGHGAHRGQLLYLTIWLLSANHSTKELSGQEGQASCIKLNGVGRPSMHALSSGPIHWTEPGRESRGERRGARVFGRSGHVRREMGV